MDKTAVHTGVPADELRSKYGMPGRTPSSTAGMSSTRWQMLLCVYATDPQQLLSVIGESLWSSARCSGYKSRRLSSICNSCVRSSIGLPGVLPLLISSSTRCDFLRLICPTQAEALRNLQVLSCTICWTESMMDHVHEVVDRESRWKTFVFAGHEALKATLCIFLTIGFGIVATAASEQAKSACCAADRWLHTVLHIPKASCPCFHSTTSHLNLVLYTKSP